MLVEDEARARLPIIPRGWIEGAGVPALPGRDTGHSGLALTGCSQALEGSPLISLSILVFRSNTNKAGFRLE